MTTAEKKIMNFVFLALEILYYCILKQKRAVVDLVKDAKEAMYVRFFIEGCWEKKVER